MTMTECILFCNVQFNTIKKHETMNVFSLADYKF